jgi:hypothetical protein
VAVPQFLSGRAERPTRGTGRGASWNPRTRTRGPEGTGRTACVEDGERVARWDRITAIAGLTGAILSTHAFPAWLGYLSGLSGVLLVLLSLGAVYSTDNESLLAGPGWFGGFLLFLVWALVANVLLLRPTHRTHAAA